MPETINEIEKMDITTYVDAFFHALKRIWILVLVLTLATGAFSYFRTRGSYVPVYTAEATVAVFSSNDGTTASSKSAQQLGTVFPYILTSGILKDVIMEDMGVNALPGTIKVTNVEGSSLLTISVSSGDPDLSYRTLLSIIRNYPKVAEYVVGYTVMEIVDDSGVPTDSGKTVAVRGNALKGAALGFAAGLGIVFIYMLLNRTVRSVRDVKAFSTIDHLGTLPVYKKKKRKDSTSSINILEHNVQQDYLEAIRLVRTRVKRKLESSGHKVLMVTSSVPGEGKSTIAANLAISLSGKNESIVLIDCDLRNPSLQDIFDVEQGKPGLMDVLNGEASLSEALVSFMNYGIQLNVLFGSPDKLTDHSEILGSEKMGEIIEKLKKIADIVILDTPPSAMLVDATFVSKYVDEAVYVIMSDYARTSVIVDGIRELRNSGVEIAGFVLNGSKESSGGYGYHSYGYGSHYYNDQENEENLEDAEDNDELSLLEEMETTSIAEELKTEVSKNMPSDQESKTQKDAAGQKDIKQPETKAFDQKPVVQKTPAESKPAPKMPDKKETPTAKQEPKAAENRPSDQKPEEKKELTEKTDIKQPETKPSNQNPAVQKAPEENKPSPVASEKKRVPVKDQKPKSAENKPAGQKTSEEAKTPYVGRHTKGGKTASLGRHSNRTNTGRQ